MFNLLNEIIEYLKWWKVRRAKQKCEKEILNFYPGIEGVGYGFRERNGETTKERCIIVFVEKKKTDTELENEGMVLLPKKFNGVGIDVQESEVLNLMLKEPSEIRRKHQRVHRPILGGISCMWAGVRSAGTLGAIVFHKGTPCILSNLHVIAPFYWVAKIGDDITQPGRLDINDERNVVATIEKYIELKDGEYRNLVDAALGKIKEGIEWKTEQFRLPIKTKTKIVRAKPGDEVVKSTRNGLFTHGRVTAVDVTARVWFRDWKEKGRREVIWFKNQIFLNQNPPFTYGGNSGSVIFRKDGYPLGLIFAGSSRVGIANQMTDVAKLLDFTFDQPQNYKLEIIKAIKEIIILLKRIVHYLFGKKRINRRE